MFTSWNDYIEPGPELTHPHGLRVYSSDKQDTWLTMHISMKRMDGDCLKRCSMRKENMSLTEIDKSSNAAQDVLLQFY